MSNSPSQMIPDMLDWRQIWGSGGPKKGINSAKTVLRALLWEAVLCLVEKWLLGAVAYVETNGVAGCHDHTAGLSRCHRSILGVTVYCRQWHPIPSHQLWERCVAVKQRQH
ncbi:hypothetical protein TNCV_4967401 [Trichonephila clavipes]|nr:hypothetical protein TNCV_4967401 [Trichonephila clavipes]